MNKRTIDLDKLRAPLRKMPRGDLLVVLERALGHVPKTRLPDLVDGFVSFDALVATTGKKKVSLLERVKAFHDASLRGKYYDAFDVNSKNFMDTSKGTEEWIAECERLFKDMLDFSTEGDPGEARQAFELLFALLRRIDGGRSRSSSRRRQALAWGRRGSHARRGVGLGVEQVAVGELDHRLAPDSTRQAKA